MLFYHFIYPICPLVPRVFGATLQYDVSCVCEFYQPKTIKNRYPKLVGNLHSKLNASDTGEGWVCPHTFECYFSSFIFLEILGLQVMADPIPVSCEVCHLASCRRPPAPQSSPADCPSHLVETDDVQWVRVHKDVQMGSQCGRLSRGSTKIKVIAAFS